MGVAALNADKPELSNYATREKRGWWRVRVGRNLSRLATSILDSIARVGRRDLNLWRFVVARNSRARAPAPDKFLVVKSILT
ncbi:MAG: hypothetical protein DMG90_03460 [Acidobacteria bacterium]|nr:MAG: hypothetical protein DMG91_03875 [Acidobacteriota bacterium]PYV92924.1 MAG: hypothetical protein DMG90_03460 [Acidobacteriota bacterium]